jgi:hypothetical protein
VIGWPFGERPEQLRRVTDAVRPSPLALLSFDPEREGCLITPRGVELDLSKGCVWSLTDVAAVVSTIEQL